MEIKIFQNPMCLNVLFCVNREDSPYTDSTVLSNRVLPNPVGVHVWEEELDITFSPSIQYSSLCKSCTPDSLADFLAVWFSWPMDMNRYDIPLLKEALIVHCDAILLFPPPKYSLILSRIWAASWDSILVWRGTGFLAEVWLNRVVVKP